MLSWLKTNRLKAASSSAVSGDVFMGLAGGIGLLHFSFNNFAYTALSIGGFIAVLGHAALLLWGKGAKDKNLTIKEHSKQPPVLLRPFMPWHYPLDFAFSFFIFSNVLYGAAGVILSNYGLLLSGVFAGTASAIGWLRPAEKPVFGLRSMQATSLCYSIGTLNHLVAGFWSMNMPIILSACCYMACNIILYTVRKENQSAYTQTYTD